MTSVVFYSWQSDLPRSTNKNFIRKALDDAANERNNAAVEDSMRVDQDTQDVPGSPPIAETILAKIDACDLFVADLSFVAIRKKGTGVPNPNVLIEYGYARRACGHKRIIAVFNTEFGDPQSLPFDLTHLRFPICYQLSEDASDESRGAARKQLASALSRAIQTGLAEPKTPVAPFQATDAKDGIASFFEPDEVVAIDSFRRTAMKLPPGA